MQLWHRTGTAISLALATVLVLATSARGSGLLLYETGAPDLGTASAGRAAMAADASTAAANPAGMTLLDRSQLLGSSGAVLPSTNFDIAPQTTTPGGGGGNAGVFLPVGAFCARGQNVREVCLRRPGNTKARHRFSVRLYERWPLILRDNYRGLRPLFR